MLCRNPESTADAFVSLLATLELIHEPAQALLTQLNSLHESSRQQLDDDLMRLSIWLPSDDESLEDRTLSLARWCTGFLAGLAVGQDLSEDAVSEEVSGALADLQQISLAEMSSDSDPEEDESAHAPPDHRPTAGAAGI